MNKLSKEIKNELMKETLKELKNELMQRGEIMPKIVQIDEMVNNLMDYYIYDNSNRTLMITACLTC